MCNDNEECAGDGIDPATKLLATLHGPGVERALARFLAHMRGVLPEFAQGIDDSVLLVVFCAGRTDSLRYVTRHTESLSEASNAMTAIVLARYAEEHNMDIDQLNANLDQFQQQQGATQ